MNAATDQLYMLAFDHRASFSRDLLGIQGALTPAEAERVSDAKLVIYESFLEALDRGLDVELVRIYRAAAGFRPAHRLERAA